ncbi:ABC transporter substrate-binding protein [Bifidobacterium gallicum]|uniref:SsuA/THI5-like domain-containing protein n=1 Tax=Bifidobacterium gallicum DSM 20093 = LMG 11596 TaxID=561180 RepID=D1NS48_9BIFI|nr:NrtA/SsuA/CpmA family ABC transporter substrate-binding protein [Bifidobacterium gallicum]EFA23500.1 hypothetical protein BIFGAL_02602 [Bifidobacterium gallicum DSM 20093 = LMG 11596]
MMINHPFFTSPTTKRKGRTLRMTLAALCATALCSSLPACGTNNQASDETDTIRVAYLSTANYLTTLKDASWIDEAMAPYHVQFQGPFNPPTDAFQSVMAGASDTSSTGTGHFINLIAQNADWTAYAIEYYDGDSQGIVAAPDSGITSVADLAGKRIGIDTKGATGDYVVHAALDHAGLHYDDVETVELSQPDFQAAFTSGRIDALATYDQNLAAAIATPGAKLICDGSEYDSKNVSIHMVASSFANQHPDIVKKLYEALRRRSDEAAKDPQFIYDAYTTFGASDDIVNQVKQFDVPHIIPLDDEGRALLEAQAQQYVDFGFIDVKPDIAAHSLDCSE